jgi:DtxR family Mn-dependent transcriptional regulator
MHTEDFKRQNPRNSENVVPLTSLSEGERGIVAYAVGGFGLVRRLAEMGLTPGVEIKLLRKCPFRGPLEVEVRGVSLALGCGVASRVFVRPLKA